MKSEIKKEIKMILELTQEEAIWLKYKMQNPIINMLTGKEDIEDEKLRSIFFNTLQDLFFDEDL